MTSRPTGQRTLIGVVLAALLLGIAANWPTRTRVGLNYEVSEQRLPLWRKSWQFIQRDARTSRLADSASGIGTDESRALTLLRWTREHVRPHPAGAQVVDDHVWSIIERGYGSNDQQADVFTTLLTYAGVPAYWILIGPGRPTLPITLVLLDGRWCVADVAHGIVFRNESGEWATAEELAGAPELIRSSAVAHVADVDTYLRYFAGFSPPEPPAILRAELQMPGRRFRYELRRLFGAGP